MLEKIVIKNFKAHKDTDIDLKPITVFIGPNNSGKSSIFQMILLFKQGLRLSRFTSFELYPSFINRNDKLNNEEIHQSPHIEELLIDLGEKKLDLLNDIARPLFINIKGNANIKDEKMKKINLNAFKVDISLDFNEDLIVRKASYLGDIDGIHSIHLDNENKLQNNNNNFEEKYLFENCIIFYQFYKNFLIPFSRSGSTYPSEINEEEKMKMELIGRCIIELFPELLRTIHFIYGIRGFEKDRQPLIEKNLENVEYITLEQRSIALGNFILSSGELQEKIQKWFEKILDIKIYYEVIAKNVVFKIKGKKNRLLINEGLGSQQMLHMFIPIALAEELDTLMIEEPEIHLHPKTQSDLMKLFLKVWKEEKKQFIISTHSEHMIYPILSSISKGELKKEDVNIVYFTIEDGAVKTKSLEINDKGMVKGGLPGFFETDLNELLDYLRT